MDSLCVNEKTLDLTPNSLAVRLVYGTSGAKLFQLTWLTQAIDSGTTLIYFPMSAAKALYAMVRSSGSSPKRR